MKTIGLIGGMSWESTIPYYRTINDTVRALRGGLHSAKLVLVSVDFDEVERLQRAGDWDAAGLLLAGCARSLESAGADFIVLCTNTMHKVAPAIEAATRLPLFHIADHTAEDGATRADLTRILADAGISIDAVLQKEPGDQVNLDIILLTHQTREKNIIAAIEKIENLPAVIGKVTRIRLETLA